MRVLNKTIGLILVVAFLFPISAFTQETIDLPEQDQTITVASEDVFTVGSIEGDEWESFSRITGVGFDEEGQLYILDSRNHRVVKVGTSGELIRAIGRSGGGPGEFGQPLALSVTRDGEVRVYDLGHQGFSVFNPDGTFKNSMRVSNGDIFLPNGGLFTLPDGSMVDGGASAIRLMSSGLNDDQTAPRPVNWMRFGDEIELSVAYEAWNPLAAIGPQREETLSGGGFQMRTAPMRVFDAGLFVGAFPNGSIAVADTTTYTIKVVEPGHGVSRIIQRPFFPREVTRRDREAERDRQLAQIEARAESSGGRARAVTSGGGGGRSFSVSSGQVSDLLRARVESMQFGEEMPVLAGMAVDWDGNIWIERTGEEVGEKGPIDIISTAGEYLGTFDQETMAIPDAFGPNGLVAYIETGEMDEPVVVVKRIRLGGN